jgi:hypothetical protein
MVCGSLLQWFNGKARLLQRMSGQKVLGTKPDGNCELQQDTEDPTTQPTYTCFISPPGTPEALRSVQPLKTANFNPAINWQTSATTIQGLIFT